MMVFLVFFDEPVPVYLVINNLPPHIRNNEENIIGVLDMFKDHSY